VLALSMGVRHITGWARQRATRPGRLPARTRILY
jgi:hypothetical protein